MSQLRHFIQELRTTFPQRFLRESFAPDDDAFATLNHFSKVPPLLYAHREAYEGAVVGVALDIGSVYERGIPLYAIHEGGDGAVVGYDHSAVLHNVRFNTGARGARQVGAEGKNKFRFAFAVGTLMSRPAVPMLTPIYYDPKYVHLWVDANNMHPVRGASVVNLVPRAVGGFPFSRIRTIYTWAEGIEYFRPGSAPEAPVGMDSAVIPIE